MEFKEILRDIISKDFDILKRRDEFLEAVKASATPKDFNALNRIELSIHILESFFVANSKSAEQKLELKKNLRKEIINNIGLQEKRANFILESFAYALGWDLDDDEEYEDEKIDNDTAKMKAKESNANTWTCECGNVNSGKFCSECGKSQVNAMYMLSTDNSLGVSVDIIMKEYNDLINKSPSIEFESECGRFLKKYEVIIFDFRRLRSDQLGRFCIERQQDNYYTEHQQDDYYTEHLWLIRIDDNRYILFLNPKIRPYLILTQVSTSIIFDAIMEFVSKNDIFKSNYKNIQNILKYICMKYKIIKPAVLVPDGDFWKCEQQGEIRWYETPTVDAITKDYNNLFKRENGVSFDSVCENFLDKYYDKYYVVGISEVESGFGQSAPPLFKEQVSIENSRIWLIGFENNRYAVLNPYMKYDEYTHKFMSYVFKSNYRTGWISTHIFKSKYKIGSFGEYQITKPATFEIEEEGKDFRLWKCKKQGEILF